MTQTINIYTHTATEVFRELLLDVERHPGDFSLRSVLADWCEDNEMGEVAACLRWTVENQKCPYYTRFDDDWNWFDDIESRIPPSTPNLPRDLYLCLRDYLNDIFRVPYRSYRSFEDAERALWAAWAKAKENGWNPSST